MLVVINKFNFLYLPSPTTSAPKASTSGVNPMGFTCISDGMYAYNACTQYVQCVYTNTVNAFKVLNTCPASTLFDNNLRICNWAYLVRCNGQPIATTIPPPKTTAVPTQVPVKTTTAALITTIPSKITTALITTTAKKLTTTTAKLPITTTSSLVTTVKPLVTTAKPLVTTTTTTTKTTTVSTTTTASSSIYPTFTEFSNALTLNGYPAPTMLQYTNFIGGMTSQGGITTKREAAMFLAEIIHESGGLQLVIESACGAGCAKCPTSYASPGMDSPGKLYCGRGYIQLVIIL